ncbi:MAG: hypothetical protein AAF281_06330, partial [Pseudomonadota bacterium]
GLPTPPAPPPPSQPAPPPPPQTAEAAVESAPLGAVRPKTRPRRFADELEAQRLVEQAQREIEAAMAELAAEAARRAEQAEAAEAAAAPPVRLPVGPPMTETEKDDLRLAVQRCWNVPPGLEGASDATVVLAVELDANGLIVAGPRLLEPLRIESRNRELAFEAAKRALIRCGRRGYDLPAAKFAQWRILEVVFDPQGVVARW